MRERTMAKGLRALRYHVFTLLRALRFPVPLVLLARLHARHDLVLGIDVSNAVPNLLAERLDFAQLITSALDLLRATDLVAYRRVLKYCPRIYGSFIPSDASYIGHSRVCFINMKRACSNRIQQTPYLDR